MSSEEEEVHVADKGGGSETPGGPRSKEIEKEVKLDRRTRSHHQKMLVLANFVTANGL